MKPTHLHDLGKVFLATENYVEYRGKFLIHRRSQASSRFPGYILGPGGQLDEGEDVLVAAAREIKEETGITVSASDIKLKAVAIHRHLDRDEVWVNFITRAVLTSAPEAIEHSDEGTSEWLNVTELLSQEKVFQPSLYYFEHVLKDRPGIVHTNIEWRNAELVRVLSQTVAI